MILFCCDPEMRRVQIFMRQVELDEMIDNKNLNQTISASFFSDSCHVNATRPGQCPPAKTEISPNGFRATSQSMPPVVAMKRVNMLVEMLSQ